MKTADEIIAILKRRETELFSDMEFYESVWSDKENSNVDRAQGKQYYENAQTKCYMIRSFLREIHRD